MDLTIDNLELENLYLDVVHAVEDQAEFKTTQGSYNSLHEEQRC